jgi:hypothetical protein
VYEYGEFILEERPWGDEWENGDPFPKDKETLGVFLHRKNYELPEHSLPGDSSDDTISDQTS